MNLKNQILEIKKIWDSFSEQVETVTKLIESQVQNLKIEESFELDNQFECKYDGQYVEYLQNFISQNELNETKQEQNLQIKKPFIVQNQVRSIQSYSIKKNLKRGMYMRFSQEQKQSAINRVKIYKQNPKQVCIDMNIPYKSLKRWLVVGSVRKKGGGRKTHDPQMEKELFDWMKQEVAKTQLNIQNYKIKAQARNMTKSSTFKASKGWLDKFLKRYKWNFVQKQIISEQNKCISMETNQFFDEQSCPQFKQENNDFLCDYQSFFFVEEASRKHSFDMFSQI